MFYVYEWYNVDTEEIFYVGKGTKNRYKQISKRNQRFKDYYENNECAVRIVKNFEEEEDAFVYEKEHILELKKLGQCSCNLDNGGTGGVNFVWTDEMREYKSLHNPMHEESQRERMRIDNPMYNQETTQKVKHSIQKIVCYQGRETTCDKLAQQTGMQITTIWKWCQRGYDTNGESCYYKGEYKEPNKRITCSKGVLVDGQFFPSLRAAADFLGVKDSSPLCKALKAGKPYKGHVCEYANQQPSKTNS